MTLEKEETLHSNMFLLIPLCERTVSRQRFPLHSNMFLLIPMSNVALRLHILLYIPICFY